MGEFKCPPAQSRNGRKEGSLTLSVRQWPIAQLQASRFFSKSLMSCVVFKFFFPVLISVMISEKNDKPFSLRMKCVSTDTRKLQNVVSISFAIFSYITRHFSCTIGEEEM